MIQENVSPHYSAALPATIINWPHALRAASLAGLIATRERRQEARTMLADIYNWFTEGFDTADLKDAKALLERLDAEP